MKRWTYSLACILLLPSCRKVLNVAPPGDQISTAIVYASDENALSAVIGLYTQSMDNSRGLLNGALSLYGGLSSDELSNTLPNPSETAFTSNTLKADNPLCGNLYTSAYNLIHIANALLAGLDHSPGVSVTARAQLGGEGKFMRALLYFYLVNLYGGVPLVLTTDTATAVLPRSPVPVVYQQIEADLLAAQQSLSADYLTTAGYSGDRTRPNRAAATALLARVYLYLGQYAQAEAAASVVIGNPLYRLEDSLDAVFLKGSTEAIWQLQPVHAGIATAEASFFVPTGGPAYYPLTNGLLGSFEPGDQRLRHWVGQSVTGQYYPYKYKQASVDPTAPLLEYNTVLRLAEVYLVRAEARLGQGNVGGAVDDLNRIRQRAGLPGTVVVDVPGLRTAILRERRVECFAEWGNRWFDLRRTGMADAVLGGEKPEWVGTDTLYPLPATELKFNPGLVQNPGY
jgi:hypothetical protein